MVAIDHVLLPSKPRDWVTPTVIGLMLVLRLFVLGLGAWLLNPAPVWLGPLYETGTYLLTLFLIWWERDRLSEYHIGWLAVGIILAFKPLETLMLRLYSLGSTTPLPMAMPGLPALIVWAAAGGMFVWLFFTRPALREISPAEKRWFWWGILAGILTAMVLAFPMAAQVRLTGDSIANQPTFLGILFPFLTSFLYQLGYAAVSEEPLFRGFLWGYLRRAGWRDGWICLFQAGLFMLSHIYYSNRLPYSFWIIVPFASLVLGWLAWRSRSIATSMAAHAALNSLGMSLGQVVAYWFFRI